MYAIARTTASYFLKYNVSIKILGINQYSNKENVIRKLFLWLDFRRRATSWNVSFPFLVALHRFTYFILCASFALYHPLLISARLRLLWRKSFPLRAISLITPFAQLFSSLIWQTLPISTVFDSYFDRIKDKWRGVIFRNYSILI